MKRFFLLVLVLFVCVSITFGQIGYGYKKWIKKHKYLSEIKQSGVVAAYRNYYEHDANGKGFTQLWYIVSTTSGKIVEIFYFFPIQYKSSIAKYCSDAGYMSYDEILGPVYINIDNTMRFSYEVDDKSNTVTLRISALRPNVKWTLGWE